MSWYTANVRLAKRCPHCGIGTYWRASAEFIEQMQSGEDGWALLEQACRLECCGQPVLFDRPAFVRRNFPYLPVAMTAGYIA